MNWIVVVIDPDSLATLATRTFDHLWECDKYMDEIASTFTVEFAVLSHDYAMQTIHHQGDTDAMA